MKETAIAIFGVLIGFCMSRFQSYLDQRIAGRNTFHDCLSDLYAKLEVNDFEEAKFFEESFPVLHRESRRVMRFISPKCQVRLREAMNECSAYRKEDFASGLTRTSAAIRTGKSHKERLHEMLDKIDESIR